MTDKTDHIWALFEKQHLEAYTPRPPYETPDHQFSHQEQVPTVCAAENALQDPEPQQESWMSTRRPFLTQNWWTTYCTRLQHTQSFLCAQKSELWKRSPAPRPNTLQSQNALGRAALRGRCVKRSHARAPANCSGHCRAEAVGCAQNSGTLRRRCMPGQATRLRVVFLEMPRGGNTRGRKVRYGLEARGLRGAAGLARFYTSSAWPWAGTVKRWALC